jgi:hypothetical protein
MSDLLNKYEFQQEITKIIQGIVDNKFNGNHIEFAKAVGVVNQLSYHWYYHESIPSAYYLYVIQKKLNINIES